MIVDGVMMSQNGTVEMEDIGRNAVITRVRASLSQNETQIPFWDS